MNDASLEYAYYDVDEFFSTYGASITREVWKRRRDAIIDGRQTFKVYASELSEIQAAKAEADALFARFNPTSKPNQSK